MDKGEEVNKSCRCLLWMAPNAILVCGTCDLLVDALVVVELDPEVLVDAALPHRVVILKVNVDYLQGRKNREND